MENIKICEKCNERETANNFVTIWNPTGVAEPIPLCKRCSDEIAGMTRDQLTDVILVTEWVRKRDREKQAR